jgi:hypothetical protein
MPTDADPNVVFGAKNLPDPDPWAAEFLDRRDDLSQPGWDRFGALQLPQGVIVSKTERSDPPLAFKFAELKGLERQALDAQNEIVFDSGRNKFPGVGSPSGSGGWISNSANCSDMTRFMTIGGHYM